MKVSAKIGRALFVVFMLAWVLLPFYFLLLVALTTRGESLRTPPRWIPSWDWSNFKQVLDPIWSSGPAANPSDLIIPGLVNSAKVAAIVGLTNAVLASTAGYALARYRFPGSKRLPQALLATQLVPVFALVVPFYIILRQMGLTESKMGLVLAHLSFTIPFSVWMMRSFFAGIPPDVDKAAMVDGCNRWQAFYRVVLPLAVPGLISVGLFSFMVSWNDFLFALVLSSREDAVMVQPAIAGLFNVREQSFGIMAAGTLLSAVPTTLLALICQRYLVRGMTAGVGKA